MPFHVLRCAALLTLALVLALLLPAHPSSAHAVLVEASPADGERLEAPPAEIMLRFNEPVAPVAMRLFDPAGRELPGLAAAGDGGTVIVRPPADLPPGIYLLSWRVTSIDAHPVGATLRFGIGVDPGRHAAAGESRTGARRAGIAARWLVHLTVLGSAGLVLFLIGVRPPAPLQERVRRLLPVLVCAGLASLLVRLGVAGLELAGLPLAAIVTARPWLVVLNGSLAPATALAALGLVLAGAAIRHGRGTLPVAGAGTIAVAFALTGHAAAAEPRWLIAPALAVHAACAAFWLGAFIPLAWSLRLPAAEAAATIRHFSALATWAVLALLLAGTTLAWVQLDARPASLWQTDYGLRLMAKLALVAILLAVAAINRLVLTDGVARGEARARRHLRFALALDVALGAAILAVTAGFPLDPPPRALAAAPSAAGSHGIVATAEAQGRRAVLRLHPGTKRLEALVTDGRGAPVAARKAEVRLAMPEAGIEPVRLAARMEEPGTFIVDRLPMPRAGRWVVRLDLLIDDFTRLTFEGGIVVP